MKNFLIAAAAAASGLTATAPAAAQYYQPQGYVYGNGYGNAYSYGYGNGQGLVQRLGRIRQQIDFLEHSGRIDDRRADRLEDYSRDLSQQIRRAGYNGIDWRERQYFEARIGNLEQMVQRSSYGGGWNGWRDRDGDGDWDR